MRAMILQNYRQLEIILIQINAGIIMTRTKNKPVEKKEATAKVKVAKETAKKSAKQKQQAERNVLNVGGGSKNTPIPAIYDTWKQVLLDIDPKGKPDVVCDARELTSLETSAYDAIYCSHNLEHYHHHDVIKVLQGFRHVVKDDGFVHIRVPNMQELMQVVVAKKLDIDDVLYQSALGPILVRDVIYGYGVEIEKSGKDYYAHKTGFTPASLQKILHQCGFQNVFIGTGDLEIIALAFKGEISEYAKKLLFNQ